MKNESYARSSGVIESVDLQEVMDDAIQINAEALNRHAIAVSREYTRLSPIATDRQLVLQILVNLISNSKDALGACGKSERQIRVCLTRAENGMARMAVIDNGVGITAENLSRVFEHGFTTRAKGHGFGLHTAAIAAQRLNGRLSAHSEGPGSGAEFALELPIEVDCKERVA